VIAAFDIGTNTLLMLIADGIRRVEDHADIVRLGEGLDRTGRLSEAAMGRAEESLGRLVERAQSLGVKRARAVGTEALRKAENGAEFVARANRLLEKIGGQLEIIDGDREARLSFLAVSASFPSLHGPRTVVDIGGGSTEVLVGDATVDAALSVPIGSVRLTERLLHHDPPTKDECRALRVAVDDALAQTPQPAGELVGIAGTVTTLAAMSLGMTDYDGERVHGSRISRAWLATAVEKLAATAVADRKRTPGLDPRRADVIYAGAVILLAMVERAKVDSVLVSDRGIRWGLVYEER
jgi:exopolyphosphatase/guanosine-5'-triphosphate,3'-diphosphate pyrophosphatase